MGEVVVNAKTDAPRLVGVVERKSLAAALVFVVATVITRSNLR